MRIAWLSPYVPAPENSGGRIRIARLARGFEGAEMHLFTRIAADDLPIGSAETREALLPFASVQAFERGKFARLPLSVPPIIREYPPGMIEAVERAHAEKRFDVVIMEHCYARPRVMPALEGAARVLDEHNVESMYFRRAMRARRPLGKKNIDHAIEFLQWRNFERMVWREVDVITTVSTEDCARVRRFRPDTGDVVPNGIDLERLRFVPPSGRSGKRILFVGHMGYDPNIAAGELLATKILPLVRREIPDATLTLAGRNPHARVHALASPHVRVTGTVDDIGALYDEHMVFAMPLTLGAGSSLKALEPLVAGIPLVASRFALRGHRMDAGQHFLEAESPEEYAREIIDVLRTPKKHDELVARAREFAAGSDWNIIARRFATLVASAESARGSHTTRRSSGATASA